MKTNRPSAEVDCETAERVVVHLAYPLWRKHLLIGIARAKELQDNGADVRVSFCSSRSGTCAVNFAGSPLTCKICRDRARRSAEAAGLEIVSLNPDRRMDGPDEEPTWTEKKDLAEGVQSAVISTFRQLPEDGERNGLIHAIKRRYYRTAVGLLKSFKTLLREFRPARVEVFNGRQACSRFCLTAARSLGIPFNTLEATSRIRPIIFQGHTAHDREQIQKRMMQHPADYEVAANYFRKRRQPRNNKYAKKHATSFEPPSDAGFSKKISVFLSSQDEFEALGKQWRSPFQNYASVISRLCRQNRDYRFCVRFHPNQADMVSDVITPLKAVEKLPNTVVYYPNDTVNTYSLIDWSDVVVTFGSTVTLEACWMGKPAVMLGPSFFDQLDISYTPASTEEFLELIRRELAPKDPENAARVAFFHEFDSDPLVYVRHDGKTIRPNGLRIYTPWLSQIARTADNVFCRCVKASERMKARYRKAA